MVECLQSSDMGGFVVLLFVVVVVGTALASLGLEHAWLSLREALKRRKGSN